MKALEDLKNPDLAFALAEKLKGIQNVNATIMEVCGTHTNVVAKYGIRQLLPSGVRLVSGPGCPVCVTPASYIDEAIALGVSKKAVIVAYGDMLRVPGNYGSLLEARANGADVRLVYSALDAVKLALNVDLPVVFLAVGFETTAPASALAVKKADELGLNNFYILTAHRTMPEPMKLLFNSGNGIDAFILPGHVSAITGIRPFRELMLSMGLSGVCAGFEAVDVLGALVYILNNLDKRPFCENLYGRVVSENGNFEALRVIDEVFEPCNSVWRGLGEIDNSGLKLKGEYRLFDAQIKFGIEYSDKEKNNGCICGSLLKGEKEPKDCPLFGKACTPNSPMGACMVSFEGACHAWYNVGYTMGMLNN